MPTISDKYNYKNFSDKSPLVVFVHGAGCDSTFWSLLNRYYFFKGYSTLAINLPGHGNNKEKKLSSIEEMAHYTGKIVKKYSSKKNILVGHSMGSLICLSIIFASLKPSFDSEKASELKNSFFMLKQKSILNLKALFEFIVLLFFKVFFT